MFFKRSHTALAAALVLLVGLAGSATAVTITVDNYFTEPNGDTAGAVGEFSVQTFTPSVAGLGVNDTVAATSPFPAGVGLQSVSFLKAVSGAATTGQLFIDVYRGAGDTGTYLGSSTNSVDVESAAGLDVLTWNFPDLFLDSTVEHAFVWSTDNTAGNTVLARIQVARDSGGGFGSSYSGGTADNNGDGGSPLAFDTRFQVTMTDQVVDPGSINLTIDRVTGNITLTNTTATPLQSIVGYSILSDAGSLTQTGWDQQSGSSQLANDNDQWTVLTDPGLTNDLSEAVLETTGAGNGGDLAATSGTWSFGNVWQQGHFEDISMEILVDDGSEEGLLLVSGADFGINYTGDSIDQADLDGNGTVNTLDWVKFKDNYGTDVTGMTDYDAYYNGSDINGDGVSNQLDFVAYRSLYAAAQPGAAALESSAIPEPATWTLVLLSTIAWGWRRTTMKIQHHFSMATLALPTAAMLMLGSTASAQIPVPIFLDDFQSYAAADPADFSPTGNWIWNGVGTAPNASRIFQTINYGGNGQSLWIASAANAAAGTGIDSNTGIVIDANTNYVFSAALVTETFDPGRTATGTYDLLIGTSLATASSLIGGPQAFAARGDDEVGGEDSYDEQFTTQAFNSGAVGGTDRLFISIAFDGTDDSNPFVGIDDVSINGIAEIGVNVNTTSGKVSFFGDQSFDFDITSYSLTSSLGQLLPGNLTSLESQGVGDAAMTADDGIGFELLDTPDMTTEIAEADLTGATTFDNTTSFSLGNIFDTTTLEGDRDLQISFTTPKGELLIGTVNYFEGGGLAGDYNNDGFVNIADYTVWRNNLGASDESALNNNGDGGGVTVSDYQYWKDRFGNTSGAGSLAATAAVPEPSSTILLLLGAGSVLCLSRRHFRRVSGSVTRLNSILTLIVAWAVLGSAALATVTSDRTYLFGDPASADATSGANVGEGNSMGFNFSGRIITADEVGPTGGGFADLEVFGPTYTSATSRTGVSNTFAANFDGTDDYLYGDTTLLGGGGLGFPGNDPPQNPAVEYSGIFTRGIQTWVRPTNSGSSTRQDIVNDTYQFGIHITENDTWGTTYGSNGGTAVPTVYESTEPVAFNQWTHVMQHSFGAGGFALYVNGEIAMVGGDTFGDSGSYYHPHVTGADLDMTLGADLDGSANFFQGAIDDLSVYVAGNNSGVEGGANYGTFDIGTDNEYIAGLGLVAGDATGEGDVNGDDAAFFVNHWLDRQEFNGVTIGDLNSRMNQADFNFDGVTDLRDAFILNRALLANGAAGLDFSLLGGGTNVPEPSSYLLAVMCVLAFGRYRRQRD